jgi:hypothetical protein
MQVSRQQYYFVLAIPVINVIADSTQGYFSQGFASPGYLRAFLILGFIFLYFKDFFKDNTINIVIVFSLIYYFILGLFSSDVFYTQSVFLKFLIASLMFPIGYYYFNTFEKFRELLKIMMWVLGIYVVFIIISNIYTLGTSEYLEDSVYFGAGRVNMTKAMMILILISPIILREESNKKIRNLYIVIIVLAVIFVIIGVKRSAIVGLFIGYFIYYILAPYKTKLTKAIFGLGIILFLASPFYFDTLVKRIEARQEAGRFDLSQAEQEEGRIVEINAVWEAFVLGDIFYKLFGAELFNSMAYFKTSRMLHTDYTTMFGGSGLIGFGFFLFIYYLVFRKSFFLWRILKSDSLKRDIMAVSITLVFAVMITGISGTVTAVGLRSIAFMFWGAAFSFIGKAIKQEKHYWRKNI